MLDALCRRAPEVASDRRVAERYMVLLVFVGKKYTRCWGDGWLLLILQ